MSVKFAFFDLETTGVNTNTDRICQIAIVTYSKGTVHDRFSTLVNPEMLIPEEATAVHGIKNSDVTDAPFFKDIALSVKTMLENCILAGFNSNDFDVPLLANEMARAGYTFPVDPVLVDVSVMYRRNNPRTLEAAYKQYCDGEFNAHDALEDVEATIKLFKALMDAHPDIPRTIGGLDRYCNFDKERVDISGKFYVVNGVVHFNFGPHAGKPALSELGFLQWMRSKDFSPDTLRVVNKLLS